MSEGSEARGPKATVHLEWTAPDGKPYGFGIDFDDVVLAHQVAAVVRQAPKVRVESHRPIRVRLTVRDD